MNKILSLLLVVGLFGCQSNFTPVDPNENLASESQTILPASAKWSSVAESDFRRVYLPKDIRLDTPFHGSQLWPDASPNLVLWQSPLGNGSASVDFPQNFCGRFTISIDARTRKANEAALPCVFVFMDSPSGKRLTFFIPTTSFSKLPSPVIVERPRRLYFVYAPGRYDDSLTDIDIARIEITAR